MSQKYITVNIPASGRSYSLRIPDNGRVTIAHAPQFRDLPDPHVLIRDALDHPIGSPRIEQMVRPGNRVCIISDDITRPTPVYLVLEELLPRLLEAGIHKEDISAGPDIHRHERDSVHTAQKDREFRDGRLLQKDIHKR